jgi:hypothetical protein
MPRLQSLPKFLGNQPGSTRIGGDPESAFSGRLKIAQRFIAGDWWEPERKSVKRTAEDRYKTASGSERIRFQLARMLLKTIDFLRLSLYAARYRSRFFNMTAVRFTDYQIPQFFIPSSKLLGYFHSSALRTDKVTFCAKLSCEGELTGVTFVDLRPRPKTKCRTYYYVRHDT